MVCSVWLESFVNVIYFSQPWTFHNRSHLISCTWENLFSWVQYLLKNNPFISQVMSYKNWTFVLKKVNLKNLIKWFSLKFKLKKSKNPRQLIWMQICLCGWIPFCKVEKRTIKHFRKNILGVYTAHPVLQCVRRD